MSDLLDRKDVLINMPVIALRGLVVFPNSSVQFDVGRKKSILAVNEAMEGNQRVFLVAQKDLSDDDPTQDQLYEVGVVARIKQVYRQADNGLRLLVDGLQRARLDSITSRKTMYRGDIEILEEKVAPRTARTEALIRNIQNMFEKYIQNH